MSSPIGMLEDISVGWNRGIPEGLSMSESGAVKKLPEMSNYSAAVIASPGVWWAGR